MNDENTLGGALAVLRARITAYGGQSIGEQNTKAVLIVPLLRALGWDVEDLSEVQLEYKRRPSDRPVDYALMIRGAPRLFLEAKGLGENLEDRRWGDQIIHYAMVAGVKWVVLSNGDEYRIYNAHAEVPVEEKLLRQVRISDQASEAEETLALLSKGSIAELEGLWAEEFIDRQVRDALERLFEPEPDGGLVRLIRRRLPKLTPGQIRAGLGRLRLDIGPAELQPISATALPRERRRRQPKPKDKRPFGEATPWSSVTLGDLISEGVLKPPVDLYRRYKGNDLHALIEQDGRVSFAGDVYGSLSIAGGEARHSVLGDRPGRPRRPQTNGWTFWRLRDQRGKLIDMDELRRALWESKGSPES